MREVKASGEGAWTAEHFRAYLLDLAHNTPAQEQAYPQQHFPKQIELSAPWHETFDQLRAETARDQHERWALVAAAKQRDRVYLSQQFVRAEEPYEGISMGHVERVLIDAWRRGLPYWLGDIHMHPDCGPEEAWQSESFSVCDLYGLLYAQYPLRRWAPRVMFLVSPRANLAACRSRESERVPASMSQDQYAHFWVDGRDEAERWPVNLAIGWRHRLVFYRGAPEQPLARVFP